MPYMIEKTYSVATAHRIANQSLDFNLCASGLKRLKCRSYHGHTAEYIIRLASDTLANDMVLDYNMFGFLKNLLDEHVDHRFMISRQDPAFKNLIENAYCKLTNRDKLVTKVIPELSTDQFTVEICDIPNDVDRFNPLVETLQSYTIVSFNTSSECIAHWFYQVTEKLINQCKNTHQWLPRTLRVYSVSYKEGPNSCATYYEHK